MKAKSWTFLFIHTSTNCPTNPYILSIHSIQQHYHPFPTSIHYSD